MLAILDAPRECMTSFIPSSHWLQGGEEINISAYWVAYTHAHTCTHAHMHIHKCRYTHARACTHMHTQVLETISGTNSVVEINTS
jgi:hypothetical protein